MEGGHNKASHFSKNCSHARMAWSQMWRASRYWESRVGCPCSSGWNAPIIIPINAPALASSCENATCGLEAGCNRAISVGYMIQRWESGCGAHTRRRMGIFQRKWYAVQWPPKLSASQGFIRKGHSHRLEGVFTLFIDLARLSTLP